MIFFYLGLIIIIIWILRKPRVFFGISIKNLDKYLNILFYRGLLSSDPFKSANINLSDVKGDFSFGVSLVIIDDRKTYRIILPTCGLEDSDLNEFKKNIKGIGLNCQKICKKHSGYFIDVGLQKDVVKKVVEMIWDQFSLECDGELTVDFKFVGGFLNSNSETEEGINISEVNVPVITYHVVSLWLRKVIQTIEVFFRNRN